MLLHVHALTTEPIYIHKAQHATGTMLGLW